MAISAENQENNALAMAKQMLYHHHAPAWQETFAKVQQITPTQLQRALRQLEGQMAISAENQENNALAMAKQMLYHHHAPAWQETFAKVQQITPTQLQDVANEVFAPEKIYTLLYD